MSANKTFTHSFCSINRQQPPAWSNRFRKDVNDLMYSPKDLRDINYIKKSAKSLKSLSKHENILTQSPIKNALQKYQVRQAQDYGNGQKLRRTMSTKGSIRNLINQLQRNQSQKNLNPEILKLKQKIYSNDFLRNSKDNFMITRSSSVPSISAKIQSLTDQQKYGLCPFEFSTKTIQGKILSKQYHNLDLSKSKTQKLNFFNTIYYDKTEDISLKEYQKKKIIESLKKFRDFKNYESHKLYEKKKEVGNGGLMDKFYDVSGKNLDMVRMKLQIADLDFEKLSPRPDIPKKLGTNLQYENSYKQISKSNNHRPQYDFQRLERNLAFSHQVISDKRGCYR